MLSKLKCLKTMTQFHRGQHVNTDWKSFEPWSSACQQPTPSKSLVYKHKNLNILNFVNTHSFYLSFYVQYIHSFNFIYQFYLSFYVQYIHSFFSIIVQFVLSFHDNILSVVMFILLHTSPIGEGYSGNRLSPNTVGGIPRSGTSTQPVLDMVCAGAQRPPADLEAPD